MTLTWPTARVLADGRFELGLPKGADRPRAWAALVSVLSDGSFEVRTYPSLVVVDEPVLVPALAVLQCYYEEVIILDPEPIVAPVPAASGAGGFLDGLPPELVEKSYKALARVLHPDAGGDETAFKALGAWAEGRRR